MMLSGDEIKSICTSRNVMLTGLTVIGVLIVYSWAVAPHLNYLQASEKYESVANNLAKKNQVINKNVIIKRKEFKQLQEKFKQVNIKLFDTVQAKEFFSDIEAMAEETNCTIYSLNFLPSDPTSKSDKSKGGNNITAERAILSIEGNYQNIVALTNKLQNRLKQVWIDSVNIESISDNFEQLRCEITITIYVIHEIERGSND